MASHLQLLSFGIMDQLQVLEHSLVNVFLESALRLVNVINAEFFIVVETPTGRRVAGSDKLCADFLNGKMAPAAGDVRTRLMDDGVPVIETPLDIVNPLREPIPVVYSRAPFKRKSTEEAPVRTSRKRSKLDAEEPSVFESVKLEASDHDGVYGAAVEDADDDIVEILDCEASDVPFFPETPNDPPFPDASLSLSLSSSLPEIADPEPDFAFIRDYLAENAKVACVQHRLSNGMDFAKHSADMRIFASIMYDVGKLISARVKIPDKSHPETKGFFSKCFDVFWNCVPGLEASSARIVGEDSRRLSLKAHLRAQCYHSFKNLVDKMNRKL